MMNVRIDGPAGITFTTTDHPEQIGLWLERMTREIRRVDKNYPVNLTVLWVNE
jgi:hypothetical protein